MSPHTRELQRLYTPARSGCCEQNAETRPPMTDWKLAQKLGHRIPLVNLAWLVCKDHIHRLPKSPEIDPQATIINKNARLEACRGGRGGKDGIRARRWAKESANRPG